MLQVASSDGGSEIVRLKVGQRLAYLSDDTPQWKSERRADRPHRKILRRLDSLAVEILLQVSFTPLEPPATQLKAPT